MSKMGRPKLAAKNLKSRPVTTRLTPSEHKRLLAEAREMKMSVSDYLKYCWQKASEK